MEPLYQFFIVEGGAILDRWDTLDQAVYWQEGVWARSHPGSFILEVRSNLVRPVGAIIS